MNDIQFTQHQQDIFLNAYTWEAMSSQDRYGDLWSDNYGEEDLSPDALQKMHEECYSVLLELPHVINGTPQCLCTYAQALWDIRNGYEVEAVGEEFRAKALSLRPAKLVVNEETELIDYEVDNG